MTEFICRLGTPSGEIVTRVVEAAAAAWRADGRAREAAAEAIRRKRLEAMLAETRAESEALAGGSALALAGAL